MRRHPTLTLFVTACCLWFAVPCRAEPLSLSRCVELALTIAPSVEAATAQADLSAAEMREARAPLFPSLHTEIDYSQQPGYDPAITNRGLSAGQLLADYIVFDGGRRLAQLRAARYGAEAAAFGLAFARSEIVRDTKVAFFDLIRSREAEKELGQSASRLSRFAAIIDALVRSGRATANDALKIRVSVDDAELRLNDARQGRRRASIVLGSLIGEYGRDDLEINEPPEVTPPRTQDLSGNPALIALRREETGAEAAIEAAEAERYPTFSLALASGFLGVDPPRTINDRAGASYGGVLSMPIYQGGAIRARIDQARARQHQAASRVRQGEIELGRSLAESNSRYQQARNALEVLSRAIPSADDAFALAWSRFLGGGNITLLEVLDAYRQSEALRLGRIEQNFAARRAAAESAQLVGGSE